MLEYNKENKYMKRVRAHLELVKKEDHSVLVASSDWYGGTYPYIEFPVPHNFSFWFEYTNIDYETGNISLSGVSDRTLKSGIRYILKDYHYRYDGYIDYEMYDDGLPCNEETLEILVNERDYDFTPESKGGKGSKQYTLPYRVGAHLKSDIIGYEIEIAALHNEEIEVIVNGKRSTVKMEMNSNFGEKHAVCLGNTEDQVYTFGKDFVVRLVAKESSTKANK